MPEAGLIQRVRDGDEAALRELFEQHEPELRRRVERRLLGDARAFVDTDDVLLEAYLMALRRFEEFQSRREGALRAWLSQIVDLRLRDAVNRRPVPTPPVAPPAPPEPSATPEPPAPPETPPGLAGESGILHLLEVEGLTFAECAARLELPRSGAKELYAQALTRFSDLLGLERLEDATTDPVAEVLADYRERREAGEEIGEEALLDEYPHLADGLRARLATLAAIRDALGGESAAAGDADGIVFEAVFPADDETLTGLPAARADAPTGPLSVHDLGEEPEPPEPDVVFDAVVPVGGDAAADATCSAPAPADAGAPTGPLSVHDLGEEPEPPEPDVVFEAVVPVDGDAAAAETRTAPAAPDAEALPGPLSAHDLGAEPEADEVPDVEEAAAPPEPEESGETAQDDDLSDDDAPQPATAAAPAAIAEDAPPRSRPLPEALQYAADHGVVPATEDAAAPDSVAPDAVAAGRKSPRRGTALGCLVGGALLITTVGAFAYAAAIARSRDDARTAAQRFEQERDLARREALEERDGRETAGTLLEAARRAHATNEAALTERHGEELAGERAARRAREAADRAALDAKSAALRRARAAGLTAVSEQAAAHDSMLSLLLAREAARSDLGAETVGRLHEALRGSRARKPFASSKMRADAAAGRTAAHFAGASFSPKGDRVLAWSSGVNDVTLWDLEGNEMLISLGDDRIWSASFSPAGDSLLVAHGDGSPDGGPGRGAATLFDLSGTRLVTLRGHTDDVMSAEFAPQGDRLLTVSSDGSARLWDNRGRELAVFPMETQRGGGSATFSAEGDRLLTAGTDGTITLRTREGDEVRSFVADVRLESAQFAPGDRILAVAASGTQAQLFTIGGQLEAVYPSPSVTLGKRGPYRNLYTQFSPSGDLLLTAAPDGVARLWDLDGRELLQLRGHSETYLFAAFSPRDDRIVTASADGSAALWDLSGKRLVSLDQNPGAVVVAAFSPAGDKLLTAGYGDHAVLSDVVDHDVPILRGHLRGLTAAHFSASGDRIVSASSDRTARVWDLRGNERAVLGPHGDTVRDAKFAPAGDFVLTRSDDGTARLWHRSGEELAVYRSEERDIVSAEFSPDGKRVLTGCSDGRARLFALLGDELVVFDPPAGDDVDDADRGVWSVGFSGDASRVFTAHGSGLVRVWKADGGLVRTIGRLGVRIALSRDDEHLLALNRNTWAWNLHRTDGGLVAPGVGVGTATFSPSGRKVLGVRGDQAYLFDVSAATADAATRLPHDTPVLAAAISPSDGLVLAGCADGTVALWTRAGERLATLRGHEGRVTAVAFSPDERRVVTASADGTARVWLTDRRALVELAEKRVLRPFHPHERRRYPNLLDD